MSAGVAEVMPAEARQALLAGGTVTAVYSHEGSPGGHNNDCVILTMKSGERIRFDAYGSLEVRGC